MCKPIVYIPLPAYLLDWFLHKNGGMQPIVPQRNSMVAVILSAYTGPKPKGWKMTRNRDECIGFTIPQVHGKWPESCCYLPDEHVARIQNMIRAQFCDQLFQYIREHLEDRNNKLTKKELIHKFMMKHHIEDSDRNYFAIDKIYSRMLSVYKKGFIC